uniref:Uncharacterized protein n=1 Tax=Acrobeloides nanus TaxID=290746 RepID=A0A914CJW6_9BILA
MCGIFIALEVWFKHSPEFEKQNKSVTINFNGFEYGPPFSWEEYGNESCAITVNLNRISPKVALLHRFNGSYRSKIGNDASLNVKVIMEGLGDDRIIHSNYMHKTAAKMTICDSDHEKGDFHDYPNTYLEDMEQNDIYYRLCDAHVPTAHSERIYQPKSQEYY